MKTKLFIIAGELSGDRLGGQLLASLKARGLQIGQVQGIAGPWMQAEGMSSLFPMEELSLMGFAEILPHIFRLKRRIREAVEAIEQAKPDVVLTIDSPGFTFRVVKMLKKRGNIAPKYVHYVAPTVWAYKPERAVKTAALFDHLLVLLPFEPPYFIMHGLKTDFVGHPVVDVLPEGAQDAAEFRATHHIAEDAPLMTVFAGSRRGELKRLLPVYEQTLAKLVYALPSLVVVMPVPKHLVGEVAEVVTSWTVKPLLVSDESEKWAATAASRVALVKSGTIVLEVAMCATPMITVYKAHPISAWLIRRMMKTPFVNLVNIVLGRHVIPELLQERCSPDILARTLLAYVDDEGLAQAQREAMVEALQKLKVSQGTLASDRAAEIVSQYFSKT